MTLAEDVPTVDTVQDLIDLLKTANPAAKVRISPGIMLLKKEDGTILLDTGVVK